MTVLRLDTVSRMHGSGETAVHALREVSLTAEAGELLAVMGPSGSGKSTLLNVAGGLDRPTSGTVTVEDVELTALPAAKRVALRRRHIGYVFQDLNLIPSLSAVENVMLPRELDGASTTAARKQAMAALEEVGLAHIATRHPDEISGGQRQRVAIARALLGERRLLLADEPTGALDTVSGDEILGLLRGRCDAGATVLLVTHEARYAAWADRVVFLRDGAVTDSTADAGAGDSLTAPDERRQARRTAVAEGLTPDQGPQHARRGHGGGARGAVHRVLHIYGHADTQPVGERPSAVRRGGREDRGAQPTRGRACRHANTRSRSAGRHAASAVPPAPCHGRNRKAEHKRDGGHRDRPAAPVGGGHGHPRERASPRSRR
ncbi:ABC transporter ATP-binding protein [Sinosporangium siamense]|uniref:ABC transporter ATP-binding protein n=1 Tax=Sinosporangium siamense TaxID=1367973 RepID=UPI001951B572